MGFSPSMFLQQVNVLYKHSPYTFFTSYFAAIIISLIFWRIQASPVILFWIAAYSALFLFRYISYRKFFQTNPSVTHASSWFTLFVTGSFLSGVFWSSLGILYHTEVILSFQQSLMINSIAVLFIVALISGAIIVHAMNVFVMLSFTVPAVFPYSFYLMSQESQFFSLLGILLMMFFAFLFILQVRFEGRIREIFWRDEINMLSCLEKEDIPFKANQ